jgi:hypothetical protein
MTVVRHRPHALVARYVTADVVGTKGAGCRATDMHAGLGSHDRLSNKTSKIEAGFDVLDRAAGLSCESNAVSRRGSE